MSTKYFIAPLLIAACVAGLWDLGPEVADFSLSLNASPLPRQYVLWLLSAIVMFELLPYSKQFLRGMGNHSASPSRHS